MKLQDSGSGGTCTASWAASVPVHDLAEAIALAVGSCSATPTKPVQCVPKCGNSDMSKGHTAAVGVSLPAHLNYNVAEAQPVATCPGSHPMELVPSRVHDYSSWLGHSEVTIPVRRPTAVEVMAAADAPEQSATLSPSSSLDQHCGPWQFGLLEHQPGTSSDAELLTGRDTCPAEQQDQQQREHELNSLCLKLLSSGKQEQQQQQTYYLEVVAYSPTTSSSGWDSAPQSVTSDEAPDVADLPLATTLKKKKSVTWGPDVILYDPAAEARANRKQQLWFWQKILPLSSSSSQSSTGEAAAWVPCMPGAHHAAAALTAVAAVAVAGLLARSVVQSHRQ